MRRFGLVATALLIGACGSAPDATLQAAENAAPTDIPHCKNGAVTWTYEIGVDAPGGPATAEAALQEQFQAKKYPNLGPEKFSRSDRAAGDQSPPAALFKYDEPDGGARVVTELIGDSWYVTGSRVCHTTADRERGTK